MLVHSWLALQAARMRVRTHASAGCRYTDDDVQYEGLDVEFEAGDNKTKGGEVITNLLKSIIHYALYKQYAIISKPAIAKSKGGGQCHTPVHMYMHTLMLLMPTALAYKSCFSILMQPLPNSKRIKLRKESFQRATVSKQDNQTLRYSWIRQNTCHLVFQALFRN